MTDDEVKLLKQRFCSKALNLMAVAHAQFGTLSDYPNAEIWIKNTIDWLHEEGRLK